jgi:L,D-peptidoglycan transpeptidase YkuD (ErfK/YbiS/YcfS/YnhG family)
MRTARVLATSAVLVAIGGCAAAVVSVAATQPKSHGHDRLAPLPTLTTSALPLADLAVTSAAPTTSAAPSGTKPMPHPSTSPHSAAPSRTTSASSARPAPRTTATTPSAAPKPAPVRGGALPLGYSTGTATRVITVVAASTSSTTAQLQAWTKEPGGGWLRYGSAVTAHVGSQGLTTQPSESKSATPIGSFTLTLAFGRVSNPGTQLSYFRTDASDWWVSDKYSRYYNTHYRCSSSCPFNTAAGENLRAAGFVYTYSVVINYNRFPVKAGAGSAFFLHVTDGGATAGCVAILQSKLVSLMRWLSPSAHPRILIGVS